MWYEDLKERVIMIAGIMFREVKGKYIPKNQILQWDKVMKEMEDKEEADFEIGKDQFAMSDRIWEIKNQRLKEEKKDLKKKLEEKEERLKELKEKLEKKELKEREEDKEDKEQEIGKGIVGALVGVMEEEFKIEKLKEDKGI